VKGRIYRKSGSENRAIFAALPGVEKEECCKCHHGELLSQHLQFDKNDGYGTTQSVCSVCGREEFYVYKDKTAKSENTI